MITKAIIQPNINTSPVDIAEYFKVAISVDCVIFGFEDNQLKVLLIKCNLPPFEGKWSLLGDLVRPEEDMDDASYRILKARTGLDDVYLEQVHTFGSLNRHPNGRVVTTAYYSLVNIQHHQLRLNDNELHWHPFQEIKTLAFDHMAILQDCYRRLQQKVLREPIVFNLLPAKFSLRDLQSLYESILGIEMDRRNFRKKFFQMGFLIDTEEMEENVPHRPGKLYKFNHRKYAKLHKKALDINF
jgi:8-oxo-dGTP diphosphatase